MTPFYLFKNIRGGDRFTIGEILDHPEKVGDGIANMELGPGPIFLGLLGIMAVLAIVLQIMVMIRRSTPY